MFGDDHICELEYCNFPAPNRVICPQCKADAQEWLDHVTDAHLEELLLIARRQAHPATRNIVGAKSTTPRDALNVAVWSLWYDLSHRWPREIPNLHRNHKAPHIISEIQSGVQVAYRLTEGEDEQAIDDDYIQQRMGEIFPMRPKDIIPYLKKHLGIRVSKQSINNWRNNGKLEPRFTNTDGLSFYHPADVLRAFDNDRRHDYKQYFTINDDM